MGGFQTPKCPQHGQNLQFSSVSFAKFRKGIESEHDRGQCNCCFPQLIFLRMFLCVYAYRACGVGRKIGRARGKKYPKAPLLSPPPLFLREDMHTVMLSASRVISPSSRRKTALSSCLYRISTFLLLFFFLFFSFLDGVWRTAEDQGRYHPARGGRGQGSVYLIVALLPIRKPPFLLVLIWY